MFTTGMFPSLLKFAKVVSLFNTDDENCFNNYRSISLLPSISKVFEKGIFIKINECLQINNLLYNCQYGFREGHSTELAALELVDSIVEKIENNSIPISMFIGLIKAFDMLDHSILINKLYYYRIDGLNSDLIFLE